MGTETCLKQEQQHHSDGNRKKFEAGATTQFRREQNIVQTGSEMRLKQDQNSSDGNRNTFEAGTGTKFRRKQTNVGQEKKDNHFKREKEHCLCWNNNISSWNEEIILSKGNEKTV